jgi:transposase-like protein
MKKTKDFRKKLRFLLSVCQKNLNIHNEQTARKDQLPAKRKEEWMQQTVKRIIKNGRTGMS